MLSVCDQGAGDSGWGGARAVGEAGDSGYARACVECALPRSGCWGVLLGGTEFGVGWGGGRREGTPLVRPCAPGACESHGHALLACLFTLASSTHNVFPPPPPPHHPPAPALAPHCLVLPLFVDQVVVPSAGNVTSWDSVSRCFVASHFFDSLGGLFGHNAFSVVSPLCNNTRSLLASALQFQCLACGDGTYSLEAGVSLGYPGDGNTFPCLPCPVGGQCHQGLITPSAGRWGSVHSGGVVALSVCPSGRGPELP